MKMFQRPEKLKGITFMLRGEPGAGKTRFALGLSRAAKKPVAVIGSDRGVRLYATDASLGEFVYTTADHAETLDKAVAEVVANAAEYGAVVADTVSDWWSLEQKRHETVRDGARVVPMRAWRLVRDAHEARLRTLQSLGIHVVLIANERPIFERIGDQVHEVGTREDTDKKDSYVADVRLRLFTKDGKVFAEVLKDRTGRYAMGAVVEDPRAELWLDAVGPSSSATAPALEFMARELIDHLGEIQTADHWRRWRRKHSKTLKALFQELPDSPTKRKLIAIGSAKKAEFSPSRQRPTQPTA